jgi:hypothetical protein
MSSRVSGGGAVVSQSPTVSQARYSVRS